LSIFDSFRLYPGSHEKKWGKHGEVNQAGMMAKINACTRIELIVLEIWAAGFWSGNYQEKELAEWCKPLL
jgi:hypothetical protein